MPSLKNYSKVMTRWLDMTKWWKTQMTALITCELISIFLVTVAGHRSRLQLVFHITGGNQHEHTLWASASSVSTNKLTSSSNWSALGSTCDNSLNASSPTKQISCPSWKWNGHQYQSFKQHQCGGTQNLAIFREERERELGLKSFTLQEL